MLGRGAELTLSLTGRLDAFEEAVLERGGALWTGIGIDTRTFTNAVESRLGEIHSLLGERGEDLAEKIADRARTAAESMEDKIKGFETRSVQGGRSCRRHPRRHLCPDR